MSRLYDISTSGIGSFVYLSITLTSTSPLNLWFSLQTRLPIAIGGVSNSYGGYLVHVLKFTSSGSLSWNKTIGGASVERGYGITETSDGGLVVVGLTTSFGAGGDDGFAVKLTSGGSLSWSRAIGGTGDERFHSVIETSDGESN